MINSIFKPICAAISITLIPSCVKGPTIREAQVIGNYTVSAFNSKNAVGEAVVLSSTTLTLQANGRFESHSIPYDVFYEFSGDVTSGTLDVDGNWNIVADGFTRVVRLAADAPPYASAALFYPKYRNGKLQLILGYYNGSLMLEKVGSD